MLPASPLPWVNSTLLISCGKSFGRRFPKSRIKALNNLAGGTGEVNSSLKAKTPMIYSLVRERESLVLLAGSFFNFELAHKWRW